MKSVLRSFSGQLAFFIMCCFVFPYFYTHSFTENAQQKLIPEMNAPHFLASLALNNFLLQMIDFI